MARKKLEGQALRERIESDSIERRKCFKRLLVHLKNGYSLDCFGDISNETIQEYTKKFPLEFNLDELVEAQRLAKLGWEEIGRRQSDGRCLGNSRSWYYNMAHRYSWTDKAQLQVEHTGGVAVTVVNYRRSEDSLQATAG